MSARREMENAPINSALLALPFDDGRFACLASVKEHMHGHGKTKIAHRDVHAPIADFVIGNFVNERWQAWHRTGSLNPEQLGIGACPASLINPVTIMVSAA